MSAKCALTTILRQAGVRAPVVQNIRAALLAAQMPGGSTDDVAGSLMRWKDRQVRQAYARGENHQRARSAVAAKEMLASAGDGPQNDEDAYQCFLFEQLPEVSDPRAAGADEPPR